MAQPLTRALNIVTVYFAAACASSSLTMLVLPSSPELAVAGFMEAVQANNLAAMGALWGTKDGPMLDRMDGEELDRRLTVMQRYLAHDEFEVAPAAAASAANRDAVSFDVVLQRAGCVHRVPFHLVAVGAGWLVSNVDLTQAGTPGRPC